MKGIQEKMSESVLIIMPDFFDYPKIISDSLKAKFINADVLVERVPNTLSTKIQKKAFKKRYEKIIQDVHTSMIDSLKNKKYDKIVYIFGGLYGQREFINQLKQKFKEASFIYYNRDTIANFPRVLEFIDLFDYKFSFDKKDCEKFNLIFLPLFYSRKYCFKTEKNNKCLCFLTFSYRKANDVMELIKAVPDNIKVEKKLYINSRLSYIYNLIVHFKEFKKFKYSDFIFKKLSYEESMKLLSKYSYVIDAPLKGQNGLTIRTLESLSNKTKIITSNINILDYDLYDSNNVNIINFKNNDNFFNSPFLDIGIINKYELSNFLDKLLLLDDLKGTKDETN